MKEYRGQECRGGCCYDGLLWLCLDYRGSCVACGDFRQSFCSVVQGWRVARM